MGTIGELHFFGSALVHRKAASQRHCERLLPALLSHKSARQNVARDRQTTGSNEFRCRKKDGDKSVYFLKTVFDEIGELLLNQFLCRPPSPVSAVRCRKGGRLLDQHHRNIISNRISKTTHQAIERGKIFPVAKISFAFRADQNVEQLFSNHGREITSE